MKKQLLSGVALVALMVVPALAADLPTKAAPYRAPPPPPPFSWTGFYVGGSLGWISQDVNWTVPPFVFSEFGITGDVSGSGFIGGGNIGYNWQFAPNWVLGIEADLSGTSLDHTGLDLVGVNVASKLSGLGTVRGRIGYAWDRALLYFTGGWAYGRVENSVNVPFDPPYGASVEKWKSGWTVGGGLEYAFLPNWTARVEALYVDLGSTTTGVNNSGCAFGFKNKYTVARVGLNYKF